MKVAFLFWNRFMLNHFSMIASKFEDPDFIFFSREGAKLSQEDLEVAERTGGFFRVSNEFDLHKVTKQYDVVIATAVPDTRRPISSKLVIMQYGLAKASNQFDARWAAADLGLVYGRYSSEALEHVCPVVEVGNPRFDDFFNGTLNEHVLNKIRSKLDPGKKTILYSPTWGDLSSLPVFESAIEALLDRYNIIYNYHHLSEIRDQYSTSLIEAGALTVDDFGFFVDYAPYFLHVSDLVLSDMSGAIFDALYCEKRVVLLDNGFNPECGHAKAEADSPEVRLREEVCAYVQEPSELSGLVEEEIKKGAYEDFDIGEYFSIKGCGSETVYSAIVSLHQGKLGRKLAARHSVSKIRYLMSVRAKNAEARKKKNGLWQLYELVYKKKIPVGLFLKVISHLSRRISVPFRKADTAMMLALGKLSSLTGGRFLGVIYYKNSVRPIARVSRYLASEFERREEYYKASRVLVPVIGRKDYLPGRHARLAMRAKDPDAMLRICEFLLRRRRVDDFSLLFDLSSSCRFSKYALRQFFLCVFDPLKEPCEWGGDHKKIVSIGMFSCFSEGDEFLVDWGNQRRWDVTKERLNIIEMSLLNSIRQRNDLEVLQKDYNSGFESDFSKAVEVFIPRSLLFSFQAETVLRNQWMTANILFGLIEALLFSGRKVIPKLQGHWGGANAAPLSAPFSPDIQSITWHTCSQFPGKRLHLKYGTVPGYFSLDPLGYAGFSEFSFRKGLGESNSGADFFYNKIYSDVVEKRASKYAQSESCDSPIFERYILFPLQVVSDSVAVFKFAEPMEYLSELIEWGKKNQYGVVVKRHPKCANVDVESYLEGLKNNRFVQIVDSDIHDLIAGSDAVFTINSGVGAEALLHLKPVFLGGHSDYQAAATLVRTPEQIHELFDEFLRDGPRFSPLELKKFIYNYTHDYMVAHDDDDGVRLLLKRHGWVNEEKDVSEVG